MQAFIHVFETALNYFNTIILRLIGEIALSSSSHSCILIVYKNLLFLFKKNYSDI